MKKTLILVLICCCSLQSQSIERSVVGNAGQSDAGPTILLDWTVGEIAVQTLSTPSLRLTEGIHQPALRVERILPESATFQIDVFPNPVQDELSISLLAPPELTFDFVLRDIAGKELLRRRQLSSSSPHQLSLTAFPQGIYLLSVAPHDGSPPQSFRVVKAR